MFMMGLLIPQGATAFGVGWMPGSHSEHQKITYLALDCRSTFDPQTKPTHCFAPDTGSNLYQPDGALWPAITTPDGMLAPRWGGPYWAHCDDADFMQQSGYPQSYHSASSRLGMCRDWVQGLLYMGVKDKKLCNATGEPGAILRIYLDITQYPPTRFLKRWTCDGVTDLSAWLQSQIVQAKVSQPQYYSNKGGCEFDKENYNGDRVYGGVNVKCEIILSLGQALHAIQDFYSHSNVADNERIYDPIDASNPPGLVNSVGYKVLDYWDLTKPRLLATQPPIDLATGCYPDSACIEQGRIPHDKLNKDKGHINLNYYELEPSLGGCPGGWIGQVCTANFRSGDFLNSNSMDYRNNFETAVNMAVRGTRKAWADTQTLIINQYGETKGAQIICGITSDTPNNCLNPNSTFAHSLATPTIAKTTKKIIPAWVRAQWTAIENDTLIPYVFKTSASIKGLAGWIDCGESKAHGRNFKIPGMVVKGVSCKDAKNLIKTYDNGTHKPNFSCIPVSQDINNPETDKIGTICRTNSGRVEIHLLPDCPDSECGF